MITKEQALTARQFEHVTVKNADGTPLRCRANGKCQVWKTRPQDFKLPVKHGLKDYFYIEPTNGHEWVIAGSQAGDSVEVVVQPNYLHMLGLAS